MAESRRYGLNAQLDIEQILLEAQHRWLRPAEICEILRNYQKFQIAPEPPNRPPSGSLFLFDRKVLRYFRKDGHSWRKKKDGKTVKEAHERLKAGSIDVLHCYYAHGEENENFQRRSYWMLEEEMSHIVLVHYREVKGNRTNFSRIREPQQLTPDLQETDEDVHSSEVDSSASTKFYPNDYQVNSQVTDTTSLSSAQASEYEDAESVYNQHPTSGYLSFLDTRSSAGDGLAVPYRPIPFSSDHQVQFAGSSGMNFSSIPPGNRNGNTANTYIPSRNLDFPSWETISVNNPAAYESLHFQPSGQSGANNLMHEQGNTTMGQIFLNDFKRQEHENRIDSLGNWQTSEGDSSFISKLSMDLKLNLDLASGHTIRSSGVYGVEHHNSLEASQVLPVQQDKHPMHNELQSQLSDANAGGSLNAELDNNLSIGVKTDHSALKQPLLDGVLKREGLKKLDSFDRWISKELEDVSESHMQSNSSSYWDNVGDEDGIDNSTIASQVQLDTYMLSPSLAQDQLFSIIDFSPNWAFTGLEIKVLITGKFLKSQQEVENCSWACMFGELEVPAEVIADGVLRCHTPVQKAGRVPFYITCSNRLACSEVREFEFRVIEGQDDVAYPNSCSTNETLLHMRFGKLLSLESTVSQTSPTINEDDISHVSSKINSLLKEDDNEWEEMLHLTKENNFMAEKVKDQLLQKLLKEKLRVWLLQKVAEGGKGPNILDEGGQGVLHFAAALGYDWAIPPTLAAGVSVNFRDVNGWTALHWAASYGRERTVGFLISLGAAPGALTDPTPKHTSGRTPADLASSNGHKGISGYLAESSLSSHLSSLEFKEKKRGENVQALGEAVQTVSERTATPSWDGDWLDGVSMKDSLAAVRNATQAAARIHQVFRVQSFQRKQLKEYGGSELGLSDERALSLLAMKTNRAGQHDEPVHAAAVRIQNKFRSWKGRRDFLLIRQRIIKIQAHVRGHQVRNKYKNIIWSVVILEKVILRWRRKGSGLRGFKPEAPTTVDVVCEEIVRGNREHRRAAVDENMTLDDFLVKIGVAAPSRERKQDGGETTEIHSLCQRSKIHDWEDSLSAGLVVPSSSSSRRIDSINDEGLVQVDLLLEHPTEAAITNRGRVDVEVAHDHFEIGKDTSEIMQLESHFEQENIEPDSIGSARSNDKVEHSDIVRCGRPLVEAECINGESNWVSGATMNIQRIDSQKNSVRQRIVKDYGITRKNLEEHFGKYRKDAAKCLRVSVPTFKRICRAYNISRWPHPKTGKGVSLHGVEPNVVDQQCPNLSQAKGTDNSAHERSTATGKPCDSVMTAKVTYRDDMIKFKLTPSLTKVELEGILEKKLNISLQGFSIKYQDEDNDWVTITEDADLREGMHESRLLGRTTMKLLLTQKSDT